MSSELPPVMWTPPAGRVTNMDTFREQVNAKFGLSLQTYAQLYQWSIDNIGQFWGFAWEFLDVICSAPYARVVDESLPMKSIPEWFTGARLNIAENLLRHQTDNTAIIATGEFTGTPDEKITYNGLRRAVARMAAALRRQGVTVGDTVACYAPNFIPSVVAMLAVTSIGAIWSSTSPDFGVDGVLGRFSQIRPKVIFSVNAVHYNGKVHDHFGKLKQVIRGLPGLQKVVVYKFVDQPMDLATLEPTEGVQCVMWDEFQEGIADDVPLQFEQLPANHPCFILYSSGTTGKPKCIVHSAGGTLVQHKKELILHGNLKKEDVIFYYSTTGWMMWNWLLSSLSVGATVVIYDGSPAIPHNGALWDMADRHQVTIFGTSAKYLASIEAINYHPKERHSLASIHTILSTGSPLVASQYDFVYTHVKGDVLLGSITGGTDIISCFAGSNPTVPVYRGQVQSRNLGMAVVAIHEGKPIEDERGDLVCVKPFPSMPVFFWNDDQKEKYLGSYFLQFPELGWGHGDFMILHSNTGGITMLGRSDGTLNPGGVRFGSAELYSVVERFDEIADSVAVGQRIEGDDERVVLFIKMKAGQEFTKDLETRIRAQIRTLLSPRHVPAIVMQIADIPYTINGKKVEIAVKRVIHGEPVTDRGALANGDALDLYKDLAALRLSN